MDDFSYSFSTDSNLLQQTFLLLIVSVRTRETHAFADHNFLPSILDSFSHGETTLVRTARDQKLVSWESYFFARNSIANSFIMQGICRCIFLFLPRLKHFFSTRFERPQLCL